VAAEIVRRIQDIATARQYAETSADALARYDARRA
jgi:hypothetical protein